MQLPAHLVDERRRPCPLCGTSRPWTRIPLPDEWTGQVRLYACVHHHWAFVVLPKGTRLGDKVIRRTSGEFVDAE